MKVEDFIKNFIKAVYSVFIAIIKTIFYDLPINIKDTFVFAFDEGERRKIKKKLSQEKQIKDLKERLESIEKLLYAVIEDSEYLKKQEGKFELRELRKQVR